MEYRLPLTANKDKKRIEELPAGDYLDLSQSGIVSATSIQSETFYGHLVGVADTATYLQDAKNILDGIIDPNRLSGTYNIDITGKADYLSRAENILDGTISPDRLTGTYDINITGSALNTEVSNIKETDVDDIYFPLFVKSTGTQDLTIDLNRALSYNPGTKKLGINNSSPTTTLDVGGPVNAETYYGDGVNLVGIVTQIIPSIGINIKATQPPGKGVVTIDSYRPVGKTIYVAQTGDDDNTGLTENNPKKTIKSAASIALSGDTIKVYPGVYLEENPIVLSKTVSIQGTELRNIIITPKYPNFDLFHVNNGCHITNTSYVGPEMTNGSSIISFQPLLGTSADRYFDAARMIRMNLNYIAKESVAYAKDTYSLTTSTSNKCEEDIKKIWKCIIHDITRGGNSRSYAAGAAYYDDNWNINPQILINPNEIEQTIDTINYSLDIARSVVNNCTWGGSPSGVEISVTNAVYDNITGIATITANNHGLIIEDSVHISELEFTCTSGPGIVTYPSGNFGFVFPVKTVLDNDTFEVIVGQSTLPHTYSSGGLIQKYENYQNDITQVKDLSIQIDPETGFNNSINSCYDVVSAIHSCVGVVTTVLGLGSTSGITPRYPGNSGIGFTTVVGITSAIYYDSTDEDNKFLNGFLKVQAPGLNVKVGDIIEIRDLLFESGTIETGITTQKIPSGNYGYEFYVNKINDDLSFNVYVGITTLPQRYLSGGLIVDRSIKISNAIYDNVNGITTITAPGAYVKAGDIIRIRDLEVSYLSGIGTTITSYPSSEEGYNFRVIDVPSFGDTFTIEVGVSTISYEYIQGGVVFPPYSKGVGPITQGPYIRNSTNFIPKSTGMKIDGFCAEPGEYDDTGVTGSMSVDSFTQYNQGGIGVSITNGGYAQLVSIYTICNDISIFTGSGGQCDLTNSNASFGNYGLYSSGVGDNTTKSIYRYTGKVKNTVNYEDIKNDTVVISGLGQNRPYDGQVLYFDELYYKLDKIVITDGGSGYDDNYPPTVIIESPTGPYGITAEASANVVNGKVVSVDLISSGNQYQYAPSITFSGGGGVGAAATSLIAPLYYNIESATEPVSGISTVVLTTPLNNTVLEGATVYFSRLSLQIATTISLEWVGAGTNINTAKPSLGGVAIDDNEVYKENGGQVIYTSTNQAGNFKVGDGVVINQLTGTISGRAYNQSVLTTVTPLIIALG